MNILKGLALVCGVLILVLVGTLLAVRYLFPAEEVRRELEQILSQQLQGHVRIASLEWDLLSGIQLGAVEMERDGARLARFDGLALRYDLRHLLRGKLSINELRLTRAEVFLDLTRVSVKSEMEPDARPQTPITLPTLPLTVGIETVRIEDSHIGVIGKDGLRVTLHDIDLTAGLGAGPQEADVSGVLDVADVEILLSKQQWKLPLHLEFGLAVDFPAERLVIKHLEIRSDPIMSLSVRGQLDHIVSSREVTLSVLDGRIDLERLLPLGRPFLPPTLTDMRLGGIITPLVRIKGRQTGEGFDGIVEADLRGVDIQGTVPAFKLALQPTSFRVHTGETLIRANLPRAIHADLSINSTAASLEPASLRNLAFDLQADRAESGRLAAHITMTGALSAALSPPAPSISEPVEVEIDVSGDETDMSFSFPKVAVRVGNMLDLVASGEVGTLDSAANERPFGMKASVETDVAKLLSGLPQPGIGGIALTSQSGRQKLSFDVNGRLDPEWRPQQASAEASLDLSGLRATSTVQAVEGTLDRLSVEIRATYGSRNGSLRGAIRGLMKLGDLKQGASLAVGSASLKFSGELDGRVTRDMVINHLTAANRMDLETRGIRFMTPGLNGTIDRMTVSGVAHADVMKGAYVLDSAQLTAGTLLDCAIKGEFRSHSRQFAVDLAVPSLNIAEIRNHLSGPDAEALAAANPAGQLSLQAVGSGTVPGPEQIAQLQIPVKGFIHLNLRDVAGSFRNHAVTGATGTIHISMEPKQRHLIRTSWRVGATRLDVGGDQPIKRLEGLTVAIEGSAEEFDRIIIDRLMVGADGVEATLEGELSGIKRLLTGKNEPLLAGLGPLFIKSYLNANLDLDRFADDIRSFGMTGSGRAGFSLNLQKKEQGPLDVHVSLMPHRLSLVKDENQLEDLDGAIEIRKILQWIPALDGRSHDAAFSPTGILPDLRSSTSPRRDLRIRQFKSGAIEVRNLSSGLLFDRNRLILQDLAMDLLGGGLGGEVVLTGGREFGLDMRLEAARLDMNRLFPQGKQLRGDSLIDGALKATAVFDAEHGRLDFGRSTLDLSLTRIGRDTLDRLLRFLDPTGSNPSIVGARAAVKLANPSSARVTLSKGLVAIRILFQEGLLARFEMDRIPVHQIKQVQDLTKTLPQWDAVRRAMEVLGADRYGVDQSGTVVLQ